MTDGVGEDEGGDFDAFSMTIAWPPSSFSSVLGLLRRLRPRRERVTGDQPSKQA
jgi:hypothetical protein